MTEEKYAKRETLAAADIELSRRDGIGLVLRIRDGEEHTGIRVYDPLPLEPELRFVCFTDRKGKELAMVRTHDDLPPATRALIDDALGQRYLRSIIRNILSIDLEGRASYWEVETDRGRRRFVLTNPSESVQYPAPGHLVITDAQENRFEIRDTGALDAASRRMLDKVL